jgi:hypothetical protein
MKRKFKSNLGLPALQYQPVLRIHLSTSGKPRFIKKETLVVDQLLQHIQH